MGRSKELHEAVIGGDDQAAVDELYREAEPHMDEVEEAMGGGNLEGLAMKVKGVVTAELNRSFPHVPPTSKNRVTNEVVRAAKQVLMRRYDLLRGGKR